LVLLLLQGLEDISAALIDVADVGEEAFPPKHIIDFERDGLLIGLQNMLHLYLEGLFLFDHLFINDILGESTSDLRNIQLWFKFLLSKNVFEHFFFDSEERILLIFLLNFYSSLKVKATIFIADVLHQRDKSFLLVLSLPRPLHDKVVENLFGISLPGQQNFYFWNEFFMENAVVYFEMFLLGPNFRSRLVLTIQFLYYFWQPLLYLNERYSLLFYFFTTEKQVVREKDKRADIFLGHSECHRGYFLQFLFREIELEGLKAGLKFTSSTFWFLHNVAENLELTFIKVEYLFSMLHPLLSQLFRVLLSEGGPERRKAPSAIFTVAQEVEDHVDDLYSSRMINVANFEDGYHF
jgi:hypothetical protein